MRTQDINFLNQLIDSLIKAEEKLEEAQEKKDYNNFNMSKKFMIQVQEKIPKFESSNIWNINQYPFFLENNLFYI